MVRVFRIEYIPVFMRGTEKSVLLFVRLKSYTERGFTMCLDLEELIAVNRA